MRDSLIHSLVCPYCRGPLVWEFKLRVGTEVEKADARCRSCEARYPIRKGVGAFLTSKETAKDMWEVADSQIEGLVMNEPKKIKRLLV